MLAVPATADEDAGPWGFQLYFDGGYGASSTEPDNGLWRSKSTTFKLDSPQLNLAMAVVHKEPTVRSRWGLSFGLQTGVDTERLGPDTNTDLLRNLYRANFSYLFSAGRGLRLTGGLINSYIGYESYLAIENPNYTRGYILDSVPYFLVGIEAAYSPGDAVDLGFYVVTGYDYLADRNDAPSFGVSVAWQALSRLSLRQNLYYGPDQRDTSLEFWRFLSDTIVEWKTDQFSLAAAFNYGTEKRFAEPGNPRANWVSAAVWARWLIGKHWSLGLRPELLQDDYGLVADGDQHLSAIAATLKYEFQPAPHHRLVASLEVRTDRSTGEDGGFYAGPDNELVEIQRLVLIGLLWSFDR